MACIIKRDQEGKVEKVYNEDGVTESALFDLIKSLPVIKDSEEALEVFKNKLTPDSKIDESFNNVIYRTDSKDFSSYKDALQKNKGGKIDVIFSNNQGVEEKVSSITSSTNPTTRQGFINKYIKEGLLEETRQEDGSFLPKGNTGLEQEVSRSIVSEDIQYHLGEDSYSVSKDNGGFIVSDDSSNNIIVAGENKLDPEELENRDYSQLKRLFDNPTAIASLLTVRKRDKKQNGRREPLELNYTEDTLKQALLDFIESMGIEVLSISEYVTKYKVKNGVDPSAQALADIANRVIAFRDGIIRMEELTEEVAHFIVEGWNQTEIEPLLEEVTETVEYANLSEKYTEVYKKEYKNPELVEEAVKREILGQILSRKLQEGFSETTQEELSISQRLLQLFNSFINKIRGVVTQSHRARIADLSSKVQTLILNNEIKDNIDTSNYEGNRFRLYSLGRSNSAVIEEIKQTSKLLAENLKDTLFLIQKSTDAFNVDKATVDAVIEDLANIEGLKAGIDTEGKTKEEVEKLERQLEEAEVQNSAARVLSLASRQVEYIADSLNHYKQLDQEQNVVYQNLINREGGLGLVNKIAQLVGGDAANESMNLLANEAQRLSTEINKIEGVVESRSKQEIEDIILEIKERYNLPDSEEANIREWVNKAKKDSTWFHANFGQLMHSSDPLLGVLSTVIGDTHIGANIETTQRFKKFQARLEDLGFTKLTDFVNQITDGEGRLISAYNIKEALADRENAKLLSLKTALDSYTDTSGNFVYKDMSIEEFKEQEGLDLLPELSLKQRDIYNEEYNRRMEDIQERKYQEGFYNEMESYYKDLGISSNTKRFLSSLSSSRAEFNKKATVKVDGKEVLDKTRLTELDNKRLDDLSNQRASAKSLYNDFGQLKDGLKLHTEQPSSPFIERNGLYYTLSDHKTSEAKLAWDINRLDEARFKDINRDTVSKSEKYSGTFYTMLKNAFESGSTQDFRNFVKRNTRFNFNSDFWDELLSGNSESRQAVEAFERFVNSPQATAEDKELLIKFKDTKAALKSIYSRHRNPNITTEILHDSLSSATKKMIKSKEEEMFSYYRQITAAFDPENLIDENDVTVVETENTLNQSLQEDIEGQSTANKIKYIEGLLSVEEKIKLKDFRNFLRLGINKSRYRKFMESQEGLTPQEMELNYAISVMPKYYKRFAPKGFQAELNTLLNKENFRDFESLQQFLENENSPLVVDPNYSFTENEEVTQVNPDYDINFEDGTFQPKLSKYKNQKFFDMFAPVKSSEGKWVATKNQNLFEVIEEFKGIKATINENFDLKDNDLTKQPQISQTNMERVKGVFEGGDLKGKVVDAWKEITRYRTDDVVQGETMGGKYSDLNVIPRYYIKDVENVSNDLFATYYQMLSESYLYKHRKKNLNKALAIQNKIQTRQFEDGKSTSKSNTVKMVKNFIDNNFFGIKEEIRIEKNFLGYKVDVAKLARLMIKYVRFRNLGLNVVIPATSYLTGEVNTFIEKLVGEKITSDAYNQSLPDFGKLSAMAMNEVGKDSSKSELNVLGEFFGIFDLSDRYENSVHGRLFKNASRVGYMLHSMANFPIIPRIMLASLHDYRVVGDNIINFTQYRRDRLAKETGVTIKEIKADWKALDNNKIRNYLTITDTSVEWNKDKLKEDFQDQEFTDEFLENKFIDVRKTITRNVSDIDGQIPKERQIQASRNFALSFVMTHRSWLSIATSNRTKSRHFNFETGLVEEGAYQTLNRFAGEALREVRKNGMSGVKDNWKKVWDELDDAGRANMRRVGIDFLSLSTLGLLSFILLGYAEEDENKDNWSLQIANLLMLRTLNETSSASLGLHNSFGETISSVFVGFDTMKDMMKINEAFSDDLITRGTYAGMTESGRYWTKITPSAKQMLDLSQPIKKSLI